MLFYVMEPVDGILLPAASKSDEAEVIATSDLSRFSEIDYDTRSNLISERLKLVIERYLPKYDFQPVVYVDSPRNELMVFWRFKPAYFDGFQADFRSNGIVSSISFPEEIGPLIFTARSRKSAQSTIVRLAVAESILRRCIFGVKFTRISEQ